MPACWHCKQEFTREHALRIAEGKFPLHYEDWNGWRFAGRFLIAPDRERFTAARLRGIAWRERHPVTKVETPAPVLVLPARELFRGQA